MKLLKLNKIESDVLSVNKNITLDVLNTRELRKIKGGDGGGEDDLLDNDLYDWE